METETRVAPAPKAMFWAGWVVTAIPVLMMLGGGLAMLFMPGPVEEGLKKLDYPASHARGIIILEIVCAAIYLAPQTAVLGAILLTGYLGGATASHIRVGDGQFFGPVVFGVLVWLGLYLRDARVRALVPLRR